MLHASTAASAETTSEIRDSIRFQKEEGAIVDRRVVWGPKKTPNKPGIHHNHLIMNNQHITGQIVSKLIFPHYTELGLFYYI